MTPPPSKQLNEDDREESFALSFPRPEEEAPFDMSGLLASINEEIEEEKGWRAWLRSRSTWERRGFISLLITAGLGLVFLFLPRSDLGAYPIERLILTLGLLGGALWLAVAGVLRPVHRPSLATWKVWALAIIGGIGGPTLLAFAPNTAFSIEGGPALKCMLAGLVVSTPLLFAFWVFLRNSDRFSHRVVIAATGAGITGNLFLELHCPAGGIEHVMRGHVAVSVIFVTLAALLSWFSSHKANHA